MGPRRVTLPRENATNCRIYQLARPRGFRGGGGDPPAKGTGERRARDGPGTTGRMPGDAVVVFHPNDPDTLMPFLDLDDESEEGDASEESDANEESERHYAETLEDGTFLVYTFQPFEVFAQNPDAASEWLAQFGDDLTAVHDDPRGFFVFPDDVEPEATSYEGLIAEIGGNGIFLGGELEDDDGALDLGALQALAGQLLGAHAGDASPPGSFEVGQMVQSLQRHLIDALGIDPAQLDLTGRDDELDGGASDDSDDGPDGGAGDDSDGAGGTTGGRPDQATSGPPGDAIGEQVGQPPTALKPAKKP